MSKKSAASLSIVPHGPSTSMAPPADLSEAEMALWNGIIDSKPTGWFGEDSAPLLKEYVRACALCDVLDGKVKHAMDGEDGKTSVGLVKMLLDMRDKEAKRATSLATKLRLTQQSRYTPQAAATADKKAAGKRPWQS